MTEVNQQITDQSNLEKLEACVKVINQHLAEYAGSNLAKAAEVLTSVVACSNAPFSLLMHAQSNLLDNLINKLNQNSAEKTENEVEV